MLDSTKRFMVGSLIAALLFVATDSRSQQPDESGEQTAPAPQVVQSIDLSTPRATVQTFLSAMNAIESGDTSRWGAALACTFDDATDQERKTFAENLFRIMSTFTVAVEAIPDSPDGDTVLVQLSEDTDIDIKKSVQDGKWRFLRENFEEKAQELALAAADVEKSQAEARDARVDPRISTPRQTMITFLDAFKSGDKQVIEDAIITLDLREVRNNVQTEKGVEFLNRLYDVLTRNPEILPQSIPNDAIGSAYEVKLDTANPAWRVVIEPIPIGDTGELPAEGAGELHTAVYEWKFSKASLDSLADMWDKRYKDRVVQWGALHRATRPLSHIARDYMSEYAPFLLKRRVLIENWQWLALFVIVFLGFTVSRLFAFFLAKFVRRVFNRKHMRLDTDLEKGFVKPIRIAFMAWVWWAAVKTLGLDDNVLGFLKTIVTSISTFAAVWAVYRLVDILGNFLQEKARKTSTKYDDMVAPLVVRTLKVFVVLIGLVFLLEVNEVPTTKFLAGLGIGGLAFALAAQDTVSNLFGSLTMLFDRPFQIGDWIQIGEVDGNVESVGMRSTRVRTFYNSLVTIPNSKLTTATIDNYGSRRYRRFKTTLGVKYETPPDKVDAFCEGVRELVRRHPYTRKDYYHVYLNNFGGSAIEILLYVFFECPEWGTELRERHRLMLDIMRLAQRLGVSFAYPTQTIYMNQGDAAAQSIDFDHSTAERKGIEMARDVLGAGPGYHRERPAPVSINMPEPLQHGPDEAGESE